jgi:pilus assembly protein FimV
MVITTGGAVAKSHLTAALVAAALLVAPIAAQAAGLGKLTVLSNLGQPLRAEIDVVAVEKNEMETLAARLASIDAYLQNNLPYPSPALGLKLSLEKRASGEPYIRATTVQAVNEPFVDVLVELTWNGGRILRAYTALLDPPTYTAQEPAVAAAPQAAPEVRPAPAPVAEPPVETQLGSEFQPKPAPEEPAPTAAAPETVAAAPGEPAPPVEAAPTPAPAEPSAPPEEAGMPPEEAGMPSAPMQTAAETYGPVKRGDTLSKIARRYKPDDVTLEQMLVVLFRSNPEAFSGKNMNRLKTGPVLTIPDPSEAAEVDIKEARREVRIQLAGWRAYKDRLAAAAGVGAPMPEQAGQAAGGRITPAIPGTSVPAPSEPKEVLRLSKGEGPGGSQAAQERIRALEEEVAARDKTVKEQTERVARLEKQIKDMQTLLEIRSKQGADLQKPAMPPAGTTAQPESKPAMPAPPAKPAPEAATKPGMPAPPPPAQAAKPETAPAQPEPAMPKPETAAPAGPAEPIGPMASAPVEQPKPKPAKKPKIVAPPPPPPSLVNQLLAEPLYLAGGAAALALLGFLGFRVIRKRRAGGDEGYVEAEKKTSDVAPLTRTDTGGGMQAAARAAAAQVTEEVDPLAEAEIYLAYGRDAQAEEILKEALAANPRRYEVHGKLLEIYAKRKDVAAFEPVARELQMGTGGQGELWIHAARLGYQLDPQNPRYLAGKPSGAEAAAAAAAAGATGVPALDEKLDFNIGLDEADVGTKTDIDLTRLGGAGGGTTTDIDLSSLGGPSEAPGPDIDLSTISGVPERTVQVPDVDFNIETPAEPGTASGGVDFDFDLNALGAPAPAEPTKTQIMTKAMTQTVADIGEPGMGALEFDLSKISLDMGEASKQEPKLDLQPPAGATMPEIDLSSINLDLGGGQPGGAAQTPKDDRWYDVQTKFDLAKAYQEMGDREGAREILREVIAEGDDEQKAAAQRVLETLA